MLIVVVAAELLHCASSGVTHAIILELNSRPAGHCTIPAVPLMQSTNSRQLFSPTFTKVPVGSSAQRGSTASVDGAKVVVLASVKHLVSYYRVLFQIYE